MTATTTRARPIVLGLALCVLTGCNQVSQKVNQNEVNWARNALERNEHLDVVEVDAETRLLTVRDRRTGEVAAIRADQVIGILPFSPIETDTTPAHVPATQPPPTPAATPEEAPSMPAHEAPSEEEPESPPSYADSDDVAQPPAPEAAAELALAAAPGKVVASGPGYTIKKVSMSASAGETVAGSQRTSDAQSAVEHRFDGIICQGARMLHIDNRNLEFDGNAVTAENGCELHITNSRITAKGVGVSVRGANVHIKNSSIEGQSGSVVASEGAQVYLQSSTFTGLPRKLDSAEMHDLGGNVWN